MIKEFDFANLIIYLQKEQWRINREFAMKYDTREEREKKIIIVDNCK